MTGDDSLAERLRQALRSGMYLDLADYEPISDQEMQEWPWGAKRTVSAKELREIILETPINDPVGTAPIHGLRVRGLRVTGDLLNLSYAQLDYFLFFQRCRFDCDINFIQGSANLIIFRGSWLKNVTADRLSCPLLAFDEESPQRGMYRPKDGDDHGTVVAGSVRMKNASLGHLSFCKAIVTGGEARRAWTRDSGEPVPAGIDLEGGHVQDYLDLSATRSDGFVNLSRLKCGELRLGTSLEDSPRVLGLRDLQYTELTGEPRSDVQAGLRWLSSQDPTRPADFSFEPYETLAQYYDKVGSNDYARRVRMKSAKERSRSVRSVPEVAGARKPRWSAALKVPLRWLRMLYGFIAGYGYQPLNAIGGFILVVLLTWALCLTGSREFGRHVTIATTIAGSSSAPARQSAVVSTTITRDSTDAIRPSWLQTLSIAFENDVPVLNINSAELWRIKENAPAELKWALIAMKLAGYVLLTVAIAGLTGLLKKT